MATTESAAPEIKPYHGSCHCKAFTYTVLLPADLSAASVKFSKCNCSVCHKSGYLAIRPVPCAVESVTVTSPGGWEGLTAYRFNSKNVQHLFCPVCGVKPLQKGFYEFEGKKVDFVTVNALTLDDVDLTKIKVGYWDGKADNWMQGMKEEPSAGGVW